MHLQVKTGTGGTNFPAGDQVNDSATYQRGTFAALLHVLSSNGVNIRGASGKRIEFGGSFTFWAGAPGDDDEDRISAETRRARDVLRDAGFDAHLVEVSVTLLDDTPGALEAFVNEITSSGRWIEDIVVGTPTTDGRIPVQLFTSVTN
jgi:hypothetical protein